MDWDDILDAVLSEDTVKKIAVGATVTLGTAVVVAVGSGAIRYVSEVVTEAADAVSDFVSDEESSDGSQ